MKDIKKRAGQLQIGAMIAMALSFGGGILGFANHFTKEDKEIRKDISVVQIEQKGIATRLDFLLEERGAKYNLEKGTVEIVRKTIK